MESSANKLNFHEPVILAGAISSEFSVGRRGASSLVIPMAGNLAASVSRHHCNINLKGGGGIAMHHQVHVRCHVIQIPVML